MKLVNRNIACIALIGLIAVAGCSKQEPPTIGQNPMAADANLSPEQFVAKLQTMKPEERSAYCAQHRGVLMKISASPNEALKRQMAQLLAPAGR